MQAMAAGLQASTARTACLQLDLKRLGDQCQCFGAIPFLGAIVLVEHHAV